DWHNTFVLLAFCNVETTLQSQLIANCRFRPPVTSLAEDGLEVAFEQGAGVLDVLFGVGFGGGDARKRFVEEGGDPPLFGEGRDFCYLRINLVSVDAWLHASGELR